MKKKISFLALFISLVSLSSFAQSSKYKCMIQMNSYKGEAAYVVISLINPQGSYEKTLSVLGPDKKWFNTLKEWHKFENKAKTQLSTITGASVNGGDRAMRTIEIDDSKLNKGYKLRFESAVEEQKYVVKDVEIAVTPEALAERVEGTGYIRFVKLSKAQ
jgi:hypothetical protein